MSFMPDLLSLPLLSASIRVEEPWLAFHYEISSPSSAPGNLNPVQTQIVYRLQVHDVGEVLQSLHCWLQAIRTRVAFCGFNIDTAQGSSSLLWRRTHGRFGLFSMLSDTHQPILRLELKSDTLLHAFESAVSHLMVTHAMQRLET